MAPSPFFVAFRTFATCVMQLYNLTLQPPSCVTTAVVGQFCGTRQQEILLVRGSRLELYRIDTATGHMMRVLSQHTFSNVRSAACFRLMGGTKNYLILGSDAGRIVVLEYNAARNRFEKVHQEILRSSSPENLSGPR